MSETRHAASLQDTSSHGFTQINTDREVLDYWWFRAMRSRLEPMKKVARMLRAHEELLLNWFRAKGEISTGAVEGLNNKIRVVTRRSCGFRTDNAMEIDNAMEMALYHTRWDDFLEPESAHRFY